MPEIGVFHPQIVHFVIALLFVGVGARVLSLLPLPPRFGFLGPAGGVLVILGSIASIAAAESGDQVHDVAERIPGVRSAVQEHEEWGERARNVFILVGALEIGGFALGTRKAARGVTIAAAVAGLAGLVVLYEAGEHGGALVYSYAGGVGTRSGDSTDIRRLLTAGLYNAALQNRQNGRPEEAARLIGELRRQLPADTTVRFLSVESSLRDLKNPSAALASLDSIAVPATDRRLQTRSGTLRADALAASGQVDSARAVIQGLIARFGDNPRLRQMLDRLK